MEFHNDTWYRIDARDEPEVIARRPIKRNRIKSVHSRGRINA